MSVVETNSSFGNACGQMSLSILFSFMYDADIIDQMHQISFSRTFLVTQNLYSKQGSVCSVITARGRLVRGDSSVTFENCS